MRWNLSPTMVSAILVPLCLHKPVSAVTGSPLFGSDFERTATDGFDDPQNNYAFSSTIFQGCIYVGTGRNFLYRLFDATGQADSIPFITKPGGVAWSRERAEDNSAEIWRWCMSDKEWERVYTAGQTDVFPFLGFLGVPNPAYAADEPGFRSMTTFQGSCPQECIYAASFASTVPGRLLIRSCDGLTWEDVFTGSPSLPFSPITETDSRSILAHEGKLYVGTFNFITNQAELWASACPDTSSNTWTMVADFTSAGSEGENVAVVSMASWRGYLYVGTQNDETGFEVWRSTTSSPSSISDFMQIIDEGAGDQANTRALTMTIFNDSLVVGTSMFPLSPQDPFVLPFKGFEVIRIKDDDSWDLMVGNYIPQIQSTNGPALRLPLSGWPGGFANFFALYAWSLQVHDGYLYLGSFDTSTFLALLPALFGSERKLENTLIYFDEEQQKQAIEDSIYELQMARAHSNIFVPELPAAYETFLSLLDDFCHIDWECLIEFIINEFAGFDLWRTGDLINWEPVTLNGFDRQTNYGIRTMQSFGDLHVGTADPFEGLEMLKSARRGSKSTKSSKGSKSYKCKGRKDSRGKRCID